MAALHSTPIAKGWAFLVVAGTADPGLQLAKRVHYPGRLPGVSSPDLHHASVGADERGGQTVGNGALRFWTKTAKLWVSVSISACVPVANVQTARRLLVVRITLQNLGRIKLRIERDAEQTCFSGIQKLADLWVALRMLNPLDSFRIDALFALQQIPAEAANKTPLAGWWTAPTPAPGSPESQWFGQR